MFRKITGPAGSIDTVFGTTRVRTTQLGFPAELTSAYNSTTGYSWKRLYLNLATPGFDNPSIQQQGSYAFEVTGSTGVASGTRVWMEPDPDVRGYVFAAGSTEDACDCLADCAWVGGLSSSDCLLFSVVSASGACSGISTTREVYLEPSGGTWASGPDDWVGTGGGGTGQIVFSKASGLFYLVVDGVYLTPLGCSEGCLIFGGGGATLCGGATTPCVDSFVAAVCCATCPPSTCAGITESLTLGITRVVPIVVGPLNNEWFRIAATAGQTYKVTVTVSGSSLLSLAGTYGPSCAALTTWLSVINHNAFSATTCWSVTVPSSGYLYVNVYNPAASSFFNGSYSITFAAGSC